MIRVDHAPRRSRRRAPGRAALAIWLCAMFAGLLASACASPKRAMSYERIDQRKQEIAMLWAQIREWRQNAGLRGVEPPAHEILAMQGQPMASAMRVCATPVAPRTDRCTDLCSLANAICENAESICRIADELGEDIWARDKCSSAKASCKEARQGCCRCCSEEPPEQVPALPGTPAAAPAASEADEPLPGDPDASE